MLYIEFPFFELVMIADNSKVQPLMATKLLADFQVNFTKFVFGIYS